MNTTLKQAIAILSNARTDVMFAEELEKLSNKDQAKVLAALALVESGILQLKVLSYELDEQ